MTIITDVLRKIQKNLYYLWHSTGKINFANFVELKTLTFHTTWLAMQNHPGNCFLNVFGIACALSSLSVDKINYFYICHHL